MEEKKVKQIFKKMLVGMCLSVVLMCSTGSTEFKAENLFTTSVNKSSAFKTDWEKTTTYKIDEKTIGLMVYGFDTAYVDEDYTWTMAKECYSIAKIKRNTIDSKAKNGPEKGKNIYSKVEVKHLNNSIVYGIKFSVDYSGVTSKTGYSAVK